MDSLHISYRALEPGCFFSGISRREATLLCCAAGSLTCVVQGKPMALEQGQFLLLAPESWYMFFAPADCAPTVLELTFPWERCGFSPILAAHPLTRQLTEEAEGSKAHYEAMCGLLLGQLVIALDREGLFSPAAVPRGEAAILCRTQRIAAQYARRRLSVPAVAQLAGVSPSYLTALFHKHLPFSPAEYIRRVKLWESRAMIREGTLNFTQIAETLEYSTVHQFSRQFKEVFGLTPTDYAKTIRQ